RGTLFFDVARIIKAKRPKMFLLENVKNLKTHDKGRTYETITKTLRDMDYEVDSILYKARDFGAPQNRERIYIVGFDKLSLKNIDLFEFPTAPKPK
ncbi:DNA cytosine methyltransferase, partial [Enterococcus faecalis]|uniref:DNA cytosine methyltransferase n=2 Tax=Enterococcus TaxID=1350 RepID=UPI000F803612